MIRWPVHKPLTRSMTRSQGMEDSNSQGNPVDETRSVDPRPLAEMEESLPNSTRDAARQDNATPSTSDIQSSFKEPDTSGPNKHTGQSAPQNNQAYCPIRHSQQNTGSCVARYKENI